VVGSTAVVAERYSHRLHPHLESAAPPPLPPKPPSPPINGEVIITELAAAVPEPPSLALLGAGLVGRNATMAASELNLEGRGESTYAV